MCSWCMYSIPTTSPGRTAIGDINGTYTGSPLRAEFGIEVFNVHPLELVVLPDG